jgi:hypothetical protein
LSRLAELDVETIALAHYPAWRHNANDALRRLAEGAGRISRPATG